MTPAGQGFDTALIWLIAGWAVLGIGALLLLWALFRDRSRGRRRCPKCWYDMTGVPGLRCPECGRETKREAKFFKTRRRWAWATVAALFVVAGYTSTRVPRFTKNGFIAAIPTPALRLAAWTQRARAKELFEGTVPRTSTSATGFVPSGRSLLGTSTWNTVLMAWHGGRVLDEQALDHVGANGLSSLDRREVAAACIDAAGLNARVALPSLTRAALGDEWTLPIGSLGRLASLGHAGALAALERAARDSRLAEARWHAAYELTAASPLQSTGLARVRRILMTTSDPQIAGAIASALVSSLQGKSVTPSHELLKSIIEDDRVEFRLHGLDAMFMMNDWLPLEDSLFRLIEHDPSLEVRSRVAGVVRWGGLSAPWGPPIVRLCEEARPEVRAPAVDAVFQWMWSADWDPAAFESWLAARDDQAPLENGARRDGFAWTCDLAAQCSSSNGPELAVWALPRHWPGHPGIAPTCFNFARTHSEPKARIASIKVLASISGVATDDAVQLLKDVASDENVWVRTAGWRWLPQIAREDDRVLDVLADGLEGDKRDVRILAAYMMGMLARPHPRAEVSLRELAGSADASMASLAKAALEAIRTGVGRPPPGPLDPLIPSTGWQGSTP